MQKFKGLYIFFFLICFFVSKTSLSQSAVAISLNEYQVTNMTNNPATLDNYNQQSDWVELYNNFTGTVSLAGYYLSNERANLKKWQFPSTFTMNPGQYSIVWLSGRNEVKVTPQGLHHMHTNFTIEQCKNQWIILTSPLGVVRDSIFVQQTAENHTRGRLNGALADFQTLGVTGWRVYTAPTFSAINNLYPWIDYMPKPKFTEAPGIGAVTSTTFEIYTNWIGGPITYSCEQVWFTTDGSYPFPNVANPWGPINMNAQRYVDPSNPLLVPPANNIMYRAVTYPNDSTPDSYCELNYLPSFCETNTYFCEAGSLDTDFSKKFGVLSLAIEPGAMGALNPWFSVGTSPGPTIHVEYYEMNSKGVKYAVNEGYTTMSKPIQESWLSFQRGFDLTIDDRRGFGCNFESQIFNVPELGVSTRTFFPTLQLTGGDTEAHSAPASNTTALSEGTGLRDVFLQTLAAKYDLNVNPLHIKPVSVYINAKYVGTYNLKEVPDAYYEEFYNNQKDREKTSILFYHGTEGFAQTHTATNNWFGNPTKDTYSFTTSYPFNTTSVNQISNNYNTLKNSRIDIPNFIDWNIINSYSQNSNLYNYNILMARGSNSTTSSAGKWHHYLWNMPATFQFTAVPMPGATIYKDPVTPPCFISQPTIAVTNNYHNGQGKMFWALMNKNGGNAEFRRDYLMRYQDLLNGPLGCAQILQHWDAINSVYRSEYKKHEDQATLPTPGFFVSFLPDVWDTNMAVLKRNIYQRCEYMSTAFAKTASCYGLVGPYDVSVEVEPANAGTVKLNTITLPYYTWSGKYFKGPMSFKATPIDSTFVFDHWELENHSESNARPLSLDSIGINFSVSSGEKVKAVFTDKKLDSALPTGFSPNGDGVNDVFGILGSGKHSYEFSMQIWNRWGQEVYKSNDPYSGWDGNFNGSQAQTGVYAYFISYKNLYNELKTIKGNVTLVR